jgi:uncharacterized protein (TIGR03000 family)
MLRKFARIGMIAVALGSWAALGDLPQADAQKGGGGGGRGGGGGGGGRGGGGGGGGGGGMRMGGGGAAPSVRSAPSGGIRSAPAASAGAVRAPASAGAINRPPATAGAINRAPATAAGAVNRAPAVKGAANPAVRAAGQTAYVNRAGAAYNSRYPYANRYANGGYYNGYHNNYHGYHGYYPYYHHYHHHHGSYWPYFAFSLAYDLLRPWGWWGYGWWGPGYGLGYGGGYAYPSYGYGYSDPGIIYERPVAPAAPAAENVPPPTDALLEVLVPTDDTRVWLDGYATTSRGTERRFSSPQLEAGQSYSYLVKASWITDDGQMRTAQRQVPVRAGARVVVDFTQAPQPPAPPLPKPKANVPELE